MNSNQQESFSKMLLQLAHTEEIYSSDINLKKEDVNAIFEWLKKEPHLPELTELQVILFLHSCYYRIELAKTTIDNYFTLRTDHPEIFNAAPEELIRRTLSVAIITMLPKKTPEGYVVLSMRLLDTRPEMYVSLEHIQVAIMIIALYFHQYGPAEGLVPVFDTKGAGFGHLARVNLMAMKQMIYFLEEAAFTRMKGVHYVNVVPITDKIITLFKPFVKKEIYEMTKVHPSMDTFYNYVPKECLPEDYGGHLPSLKSIHEKNVENLVDHLHFFKWHDTQKIDEKKRVGISKNKNSGFGTEGSFRKLELD